MAEATVPVPVIVIDSPATRLLNVLISELLTELEEL